MSSSGVLPEPTRGDSPHEAADASGGERGPAARFPRLRRALCEALNSGRHWTARNTFAACGTWRELEAVLGRDLPTHDAQLVRVDLDEDQRGLSIRVFGPTSEAGPQDVPPLAHLSEGVDY